jgi:integrase/recombinase XerC
VDIQEALDGYCRQLAADGRSPHTIASVRRHVGLFATWLRNEGGPTDVRQLRHEDVARFLVSPALLTTHDGRSRGARSGNIVRGAVRTFGRYMADAGYTEGNVARLVRLARCGPPPPRMLNEEEIARLLAVVDKADGRTAARDRMLVRVLLGSGLRLGSAVALRLDDIDLARGMLVVRRTKNDRPLVLPIAPTLARQLGRYVKTVRGPVLFEGVTGQSLSTRSAGRRIQLLADAAGLRGKAFAHALRHSFGQRLYERTRDIALVGAALGHRGPGTAAVYARVTHDALRAALQ